MVELLELKTQGDCEMKNDSMNLSKNEMMMVMHDQEQEIEKLKAQVSELQTALDNYDVIVNESGTLAEASAQINELFEAAQATANTYLEGIKKKAQQSESALADVEKEANEIIAEAEEIAQKRLAAADAEVEEKWKLIEERLLSMYESHQGLKELVNAGIFAVNKEEK